LLFLDVALQAVTPPQQEEHSMKQLALSLAAVLATTGFAFAQAEAPAAKKDSGSLSSGAKDSMPATDNEDGTSGSASSATGASSGASTGESGSSNTSSAGAKGVGGTSDPAAGNK
jgi:hypothetical protein